MSISTLHNPNTEPTRLQSTIKATQHHIENLKRGRIMQMAAVKCGIQLSSVKDGRAPARKGRVVCAVYEMATECIFGGCSVYCRRDLKQLDSLRASVKFDEMNIGSFGKSKLVSVLRRLRAVAVSMQFLISFVVRSYLILNRCICYFDDFVCLYSCLVSYSGNEIIVYLIKSFI